MLQFDLNQKGASPVRQYAEIGGHVGFVVFILVEIIFNYFMCVTTRNTGPSSSYDIVVRELAESTNLEYPKTPQEVARFRRDFNDKILIRMRRRQAREAEERERNNENLNCCDADGKCSGSLNSTNTGTSSSATGAKPALATTAHDEENITLRKNTRQQKSTNKTSNRSVGTAPAPQIRSWMLMASDEWGFCSKTNQPKPPRSHYDHVSKSLVLCLDHYCPWMFNSSKFCT
jgi:hypothetical protein